LQDPPKFTQIWIYGLKTNHLATLIGSKRDSDKPGSIQVGFRVTRLGEFSPIGRLFTLGTFLKITKVAHIRPQKKKKKPTFLGYSFHKKYCSA
jgi:hypothetical protein